MDTWGFSAALLLLAGTVVQFLTSLVDLRHTQKQAIEVWSTEDELLNEERLWRRRRARRMLAGMRDPEIDRDLRHVKRTLFGWTLLLVGAAMAVLQTLSS